MIVKLDAMTSMDELETYAATVPNTEPIRLKPTLPLDNNKRLVLDDIIGILYFDQTVDEPGIDRDSGPDKSITPWVIYNYITESYTCDSNNSDIMQYCLRK